MKGIKSERSNIILIIFVFTISIFIVNYNCEACPISLSNYYLMAISNTVTDEDNNDNLVNWFKGFPNWENLEDYDGKNPQEKDNPIWKLDKKDGKEIRTALEDFENTHDVLNDDVFIFYYSGHMTKIDDQKTEDKGKDESDGKDEALMKEGSKDYLIDDELTEKINAIGDNETLRLVILDTCYAESFWTGEKDLKNIKGGVWLFSSSKDEKSYTPKWHDSILRIKKIDEIDKGYTASGDGWKWQEKKENGKVTFEEWAHWTREIADNVGHEVPGYFWGNNITEKQWRRPIITTPEPANSKFLIVGLLSLFCLLRKIRV